MYLTSVNVAKRLQDLNYNGYIGAGFIAVVYLSSLFGFQDVSKLAVPLGVILHLFLLLKKGTTGPNFYGPDPLEKDN